jgi:hypothetical protein
MSEALQPRRSDLAYSHHDHPRPADPLLDLKEEPDGTHSQRWIDIKEQLQQRITIPAESATQARQHDRTRACGVKPTTSHGPNRLLFAPPTLR